jgi:arylsulfatase A-like enzyme
VFDKPVGHVDIFATAAAAAGGVVPKDRTMDGVNLIEAVTASSQSPPHKSLYWRDGDYKVLLSGDFKLQVSARPSKVWLFNLKDDPTERKNLADAMPDKVKDMQQTLAAVDAEQVKPHFPALMEAPVLIDKPLSFPYEPGDEYVYWAN